MKFKITSSFKPTGDQPEAIDQICEGFNNNFNYQTLQGVTGSGKTFTVANVVERLQKPTLVLAHNKTLAAQLYSEFKSFFPDNAVEYFVSYYDYYQPEAYIPSSGLYIEKDLSINDEIEKLRLSTTSSLLSGRRDIIVVASVSCLYGIGNPNEFKNNMIQISEKQLIPKMKLLRDLVKGLYSRTTGVFSRGNFRVKGDIVDVFPGYSDVAYKIYFFGDEIEEIEVFNPIDSTQNLVIITDSINNKFAKEFKKLSTKSHFVESEKGGFVIPELIDSLLVDSLKNQVIFESQDLGLAANVTSLLNSQVGKERDVQLFSSLRTAIYDNVNISRKHLGNIKFTYLNDNFPRETNERKKFKDRFLNKYGDYPSKESYRAYDVTLDVILRLAYQNKIFSDKIEETNYIENKFKYLPDDGGGYSNFGYYILQNRDYKIIEIKK